MPAIQDSILTGPTDEAVSPSFMESDIYKGVLENPTLAVPKYLKAMGMTRAGEEASLKLLILDQFGNYLPSLYAKNPVFFSTQSNCDANIKSDKLDMLTEKKYDPEYPVNCAILVENSAISTSNRVIFDNVKDYTFSLASRDYFSFGFFNQNIDELVPLSPAKIGSNILFEKEMTEASGLCALNKSLYKALVKMSNYQTTGRKIIVAICQTKDNASIVYSTKEIIDAAVNYGISIYTVGIGNAVDSYSLRQISEASGARYYHIEQENISSLQDVLREISFAQKAYYELKIPVGYLQNTGCETASADLILNFEDVTASAPLHVYDSTLPELIRHQSLVSFRYKDTAVDESFNDNIKTLAAILRENPDHMVELIGHSGIEGSSEENDNYSKTRALAVKNLLLVHGAGENQVKIRYEGASRPLYYFENTAWQQYFNRRVEVRWLNPVKSPPYEIVAGQFWNEEEAHSSVVTWTEAGYKAYFDRYIQNLDPVYKVKLWGYGTEEEAKKEMTKLKKKNKNLNLMIE